MQGLWSVVENPSFQIFGLNNACQTQRWQTKQPVFDQIGQKFSGMTLPQCKQQWGNLERRNRISQELRCKNLISRKPRLLWETWQSGRFRLVEKTVVFQSSWYQPSQNPFCDQIFGRQITLPSVASDKCREHAYCLPFGDNLRTVHDTIVVGSHTLCHWEQ